jgi:hypothetical protein
MMDNTVLTAVLVILVPSTTEPPQAFYHRRYATQERGGVVLYTS